MLFFDAHILIIITLWNLTLLYLIAYELILIFSTSQSSSSGDSTCMITLPTPFSLNLTLTFDENLEVSVFSQ